MVAGLLPDVMIFERAVRCALDYHEFFSPRDLDKAARLLEEGIQRAAVARWEYRHAGIRCSTWEAMLASFAPDERTTLVVANGVYGERMAAILEAHRKWGNQ